MFAWIGSRIFSTAVVAAAFAVLAGCSGSSGDSAELKTVPDIAFEGGAGEVAVQFEINQPSQLKATFAQYDEEGMNEQSIYVCEDLAPGNYTRSVDVSPDTYVYFEIGVPEATVGATLNMVVSLDGSEVYRESDRLTEPLEGNYAFFVQFEADDTDQIRSWVR